MRSILVVATLGVTVVLTSGSGSVVMSGHPDRRTPEAAAPAASAPRAGASGPGTAKQEVKPAVTGDPLGDLAKAKSAGSTADPFIYFIQAGAYRTPEDAEAQRAKLSLIGLEAKVTEREQSGRTVYRVRVGPFEKKEEADKQKERLESNGVETALVRQQR